MTDRTVMVTLKAQVDNYIANMKRAQASTSLLGREITGQGKTAKADLDQIGRGAALMAGGVALGFGMAAKAAIDWESAWAGVTKTVDGSAAEMASLEQGLRDLSKELPATHGEIAAVAEAAGQLGIQRGAIEGFTRTMIDLGETTNLTADQAATSMARMANIMQTPQVDIQRMASTLVALGNAGASTESEILDMSMRIAGAAKQVGISEAATLGFANALSSVGIEAEAGGTAISRVFSVIASAVADGGDSVTAFADIAGMSASAFATAFEEDAAGATIAFIEGLDGIKASGGNVFAVLQELELGDIRVRDALLRAAGAGDLFRESLALGAKEWETNNALQTEAEKRYDTTAAKLEIARNNVTDLAIDVGGVLLPALASAAEGASTMVQGFSAMPDAVNLVAVGLGGVATAGLGTVAAAAILVPKINQVRTALLGMGAAGRVASAAMPWLAAAAAAVGAVAFVFGEQAKEAEEAEDRVKGFTDAIREAGDAADGTRSRIADLAAENPNLAELLDKTGTTVDDMTAALVGSEEGFQRFMEGLAGSAAEAEVSEGAMRVAVLGLADLRIAALEGATQAETLGRVLDDTGGAAESTAPKMGTLADSLGLNAEQAKEAREEFEDLLDAYRGAVDPLFGMLDALRANREAMAAESAARAEGLTAIADAADDLSDAEADLRAARGTADNAEGIASAEERVADARERLTDVQADAAVTAEELAEMNQAVAESALDVEIASRELAVAVEDGTVSVETAKAMLDEWVAQGVITADQAASVADQFGIAAGKADEFAGDYVATAYANTAPAQAAWAALYDQIAATYRLSYQGGAPISINQADRTLARAGGGPVWPDQTFLVGEQGPELVRFGSTGTVIPHDQSMAALTPASGFGSGGSTDNSRHTTFQVQPTIYEATSPRETASEVIFEARVLAAGMH